MAYGSDTVTVLFSRFTPPDHVSILADFFGSTSRRIKFMMFFGQGASRPLQHINVPVFRGRVAYSKTFHVALSTLFYADASELKTFTP
ncbi:MAG TPA: hypothetical protein ENO00_06005 [Deltaproteobacteria bacterium]|nr:hypothetical protein [Deltaproteobacteria bacterium]